jgi:aminoglycoside phosphotransferase (APT) family kinase protein
VESPIRIKSILLLFAMIKPMAEISPKIIALATMITALHLSKSLSDIQHITGKGEVNQVYVLTISDGQKVVLRFNEKIEFERFKKEQWCIETMTSRGIPGPSVLVVDTENNYVYMLLEYIEGKNGDAIASSSELWQTLGRYLRLIHRIPTDGFGENIEDIRGDDSSQWQEYLSYNIDSLTNNDKLIKMKVFDPATSERVKQIFKDLSTQQFSFGLNHGDYSLANVIVDNQSKPHIIDWGSAQAHVVPHHDLGIILSESLDESSEEFVALLVGYGMAKVDFNNIKSEIISLQLLEAVDKLRWAVDKAPHRIEYHSQQVKKFLLKAKPGL